MTAIDRETAVAEAGFQASAGAGSVSIQRAEARKFLAMLDAARAYDASAQQDASSSAKPECQHEWVTNTGDQASWCKRCGITDAGAVKREPATERQPDMYFRLDCRVQGGYLSISSPDVFGLNVGGTSHTNVLADLIPIVRDLARLNKLDLSSPPDHTSALNAAAQSEREAAIALFQKCAANNRGLDAVREAIFNKCAMYLMTGEHTRSLDERGDHIARGK